MHISGTAVGRLCRAAASAAAMVCLASVTGSGPARVARPGPFSGPPPPPLSWSPCPNAPGFDCATATVPLDYRRPAARTIELAVIRRRATGPGRTVGTLFFNPGGPGGAGTKALPLVYEAIPAEVRGRFDVVSWDPRGVGDSTAVRCFDTPQEAIDFQRRLPVGFPVGEAERTTWITAQEELGRRCAQRDPELLRHVSTADTARDLDRLRRAVGDPRLNYLGISYGTFLGAVYANLFPAQVRAMVLDANIDPRAWVDHGFRTDPRLTTFQRTSADLGSAATLRQFLDLCGRSPTGRCAFSAGSPAATRGKFDRLMRRLQTAPQGAWTYGRTVGTVVDNLYAVNPQWTSLATALQDLWQYREPETPAPQEGPPPYPGYEQIEAIRCAESPNPRDPRLYPALEEFGYARSGDVGRVAAWATEACATWPVTAADPYTGPWDRPTARPVLVVNNTYDPATPYQGAVALARELGDARLLTVDGYGHAALTNPRSCADAYESRYLVDGVLPKAGTVCRPDEAPFTHPRPRGGLDTGGGGKAGHLPGVLRSGRTVVRRA
ncbi:alpha/beta hydrolase [Streptomyces sp. NPDC059165]|uniref:alpha/beta hydrolase n=1 Tax=Streptomyces sp. NPDC059165 TaxID=3346751 RepID=UPI0036B25302